MKKERKSNLPKRDASKDKKRILIAVFIIVGAFAVLGLLLGVLSLVEDWLAPEPDDVSLYTQLFYEADYNKNIYEDKAYMSLNRDILYSSYGMERVINAENAKGISPSADFFVEYFKCITDGDYKNYPSFFTEECIKDKNSNIPEKFTMQGIYDINVKLFKREQIKDTTDIREIYEVSYRIFENNGTFRDDIYPDDTRTLVFELRLSAEDVKIAAIAFKSEK